MKNLKKVLSLSLALVMLLGMMIMPQASAAGMTAADLVDQDDIKNLDAVALLVDLGIIEGKPGNVYDPAGIVDRATMAKIVTTLLLNSADANQFLGTSSDLADIKGNWAEGYILYGYSQGIIAGDGLGSFYPSNEVTVAEAAKMLLVTLGYDANKAGLVGTDWSVNTISLATNVGILSGVTQRSADKLDRDNLALMMYNTLFASQVAYNTLFGNEPISKNNTLGLATYGLVKVTGLVQKADNKEVTFVPNTVESRPEVTITTGTGTSAVTSQGITSFKLGDQQNFIGKYATGYVQVKTTTVSGNGLNLAATVIPTREVLKVYSSVLTPANVDVAVSHNGTTLFDLLYGKNAIASVDDETRVYLNEVLQGTVEAYNDQYLTKTKLSDLTDAKGDDEIMTAIKTVGNVVTFSDTDGNGIADVMYVMAYTAAQVTNVTSKDITLSATFDSKRKWAVEDVFGAEDLAADDYVYGYVNSNDKLVLLSTDSVDVKITSVASKTIAADGTSYSFTGFALNKIDDTNLYAPKNEVTLFTDSYGYIVAAELIDASYEVAFLVKANDMTQIGTYFAELIFTDGTKSIVSVSETYDAAATAKKYIYSSSVTPTAPTSTQVQAVDGVIFTNPEVVKFTRKDDGSYKLTQMPSSVTAGRDYFLTASTVTNKATTVGAATVTQNTVFVDGKNNVTYTGFNAVPTFTGAVVGSYVKKDATVASFVFIADGTTSLDAKNLFFVTSEAAGYVNYGDYFTVNVVTADGLETRFFEKGFPFTGTGLYLATSTTKISGVTEPVYSGATRLYAVKANATSAADYQSEYGRVLDSQAGIVSVNNSSVEVYAVDSDTVFINMEYDKSPDVYKNVSVAAGTSALTSIINSNALKSNIQIIGTKDVSGKEVAKFVIIFDKEELNAQDLTFAGNTPVVTGTGGTVNVAVTYKEFGATVSKTPTVTGTVAGITVTPGADTVAFAVDNTVAAGTYNFTVTVEGVSVTVPVIVSAT